MSDRPIPEDGITFTNPTLRKLVEDYRKDKNRPEDQPMPTTSEQSRDVQQELVRMVQERRQLGIQRYGSPLMTHNGRDALQDALEEAVDLAAYLMQLRMERDDARKNFDGGESWMEEFYTTGNFEQFTVHMRHKHCSWESDSIDRGDLREQLQLAYNHLEECDGK